jgi:small subunit ribosomal protein S16
MLTIRLSRIGKNKKPMYRLIISEKTKDPYGDTLEILGSYNPFTKNLQVKEDRLKYWLSQGVQMSPTVNNLLISKNIIQGEKKKASKSGKKKDAPVAKTKTETKTETKPAEVKTEEKPEEKPEE